MLNSQSAVRAEAEQAEPHPSWPFAVGALYQKERHLVILVATLSTCKAAWTHKGRQVTRNKMKNNPRAKACQLPEMGRNANFAVDTLGQS